MVRGHDAARRWPLLESKRLAWPSANGKLVLLVRRLTPRMCTWVPLKADERVGGSDGEDGERFNDEHMTLAAAAHGNGACRMRDYFPAHRARGSQRRPA